MLKRARVPGGLVLLVATAYVGVAGCVGDDPAAVSAGGGPEAGAPNDGTAPDSAATDSPSDGPSADGSGCTAFVGVACIDPNTLSRCRADGTSTEAVACPKGCTATPAPHCSVVAPTGIAPAADFATAGVGPTVLDVVNIVHSDTGLIEGGKRAANANPTAFAVDSGIGFHVVTAGGNSVGVFVFDKLTINGTVSSGTATPVKVVGTHSVVFLAKSDVTLVALSVAADCTANTPGPGGFAGGIPTAALGGGPGGGAGGAIITFYGGGGGGGHGDHGGTGATIAGGMGGAGGAGGGSDADTTLLKLVGGSGGGATPGAGSNGGAGGGAVQIVSQTSISITGGIAAGGCGGKCAGSGGGGGGAGGAILLEAPTVTVGANGFLVAGGGGGGGGVAGGNGNAPAQDLNVVLVGRGGLCGGSHCGGDGAHLLNTFGANGTVDGQQTGAGGGAIGRVRINTLTGAATLSTSGSLYVPSTSSATVFTQGLITIN